MEQSRGGNGFKLVERVRLKPEVEEQGTKESRRMDEVTRQRDVSTKEKWEN